MSSNSDINSTLEFGLDKYNQTISVGDDIFYDAQVMPGYEHTVYDGPKDTSISYMIEDMRGKEGITYIKLDGYPGYWNAVRFCKLSLP
jgi:hypothetical protein